MNKLENLDKIIKQLKSHPQVVTVFLFGSYVKGTNKPISDVDIAVILNDINPQLEAEIGSLYSKNLDLLLFHRLPLHIQFEVLKYGKEIFNKDKEYLLEIKLNVLKEYLETSWLYQRIKSKVMR